MLARRALAGTLSFAALTSLGLVGASPATASVAAEASPWTVAPTPDGWRVTWHGDRPLPIGANRLTIRSDGRILGPAREDGNDAVGELATLPPGRLELWRGDERIDTPAHDRRSPSVDGRRDPAAEAPVERTGPPASFDPGRRGRYATYRRAYELDGLPWREYPAPIEVVGEITLPRDAPGPRPLVLILHGRHSTCYRGGPNGEANGDWPCSTGWLPIPSHLGYRTMADLLASQGNIVVSISANGINGQDWVSTDGGAAARSKLIRHHLTRLAEWNAGPTDPWGGRLRGRIDLDRVVLIGHSRGGEGVARATIESRARDPWRIRGLVPIGPTAFGGQVPANVHVAVLLPYCDGDVSDLQGQLYVDGARDVRRGADKSLRSAVMVYGANHNFFNAEWTPGLAVAPAWDDWSGHETDTTWCSPFGSHRLTPIDQQRVGATYAAALVKFALDGDRRTLELLDGPASAPASAANARVRATAIGGDRTILWKSARRNTPVGHRVTVDYCSGRQPRPLEQCNPGSPHWPGFTEVPTLSAHRLRWERDGRVRIDLPEPADLRRARRLELRIALSGDTSPTPLRLRLVDHAGRRREVAVHPTPLSSGPGPIEIRKAWARALRADLRGLDGIDLGAIVAIELVTTGNGDAYVFDLAAVGARVIPIEPAFLPLLDIGNVEVDEGDEPGRVANVPIRIRGHFDRPLRYTVAIPDQNYGVEWRTITFEPGTTEIVIPIAWDGDNEPWGTRELLMTAYAQTGGLTRSYIGGLRIVDDEAWPRLSVEPLTPTGTESTGITLTLRIPSAQTFDYLVFASFVPPGGAPEIDSRDVSEAVWQSWTIEAPHDPPVKPSDAFAFVQAAIPAGETEVVFTIPFESDGVAEGPEAFRLEFYDGVDTTFTVEATITDS